MSIKEKLLDDLKNAMRNKDSIRKNVIQMVRSAVLQVEKDTGVSLDDDGVMQVMVKENKKRKDALPQYEKSGRQDLIENLKKEIEILHTYLPEQLGESELEGIVRDVIRETGAETTKDIGKVMKEAMPKVRGRADGRTVNSIARRILNGD